MIKVIRSHERRHADRGWLSTYWHFSFDDYYDPANMNWGPLRVFNDDTIQPGKGFGQHPHRDMEIITYVLEGELEHKDSQGNRGVLRPGEVQVMSAGAGIVHAEYNHSAEHPVHLLQLWVLPRTRGLKPRWEQRQFTLSQQKGKLLPVVSPGKLSGTLAIDQDATIYVAAPGAGQTLIHASSPDRKAYLFVISGSVGLNGTALGPGDQARIDREPQLTLKTEKESRLMLLDLPR